MKQQAKYNCEPKTRLLAITAAAAAATLSTAATPIASFAATATATAAAPISPFTTAAGRTFFAWTGFVDSEWTALEVLGMEHLNGLLRVLFGTHLDEREASRATRHAVLHDVD